MRHKVAAAGLGHLIAADSVGTHGYHIGEPPDPRSIATAMRLGKVDMSSLRARQVTAQDFHDFDWLVAMDAGHHEVLARMLRGNGECRGSIRRFMAFLDEPEGDVPDPYYGGQGGFDRVYDMIDRGCERMLSDICRKTGLCNK